MEEAEVEIGVSRSDLVIGNLVEELPHQEEVVVLGEGPQQAEGVEGRFAVVEISQEVLYQICLAEWPESPGYLTSIAMSDVCPSALGPSLTSNSAHPTRYGWYIFPCGSTCWPGLTIIPSVGVTYTSGASNGYACGTHNAIGNL